MMLLPSMNRQEIEHEVLQDLNALLVSTIPRLGEQYDRERRNSNIDRTKDYPKFYSIKTHKKNRWEILFHKAPAQERYNRDPCHLLFTYYRSDEGFTVLKPQQTGNGCFSGIGVYGNHFFNRYTERMGLNISDPIMKAKNFFISNGFGTIHFVGLNTIQILRDGLALGEIQPNDLVFHRTFVSNNLMRADQVELRAMGLENLENEINGLLNQEEFNKDDYFFKADMFTALTE
jgi:hypothetical protein